MFAGFNEPQALAVIGKSGDGKDPSVVSTLKLYDREVER